jgi:hypothetical protein
MFRQSFRCGAIAFLALSFLSGTRAAAPPVEYKLTQVDRLFLGGLKDFLFDPIGAQWVVVPLIPGNAERMGWLKGLNADGTAKVHFTDGASTSVRTQRVTPIDFITSCKEFLQPTGKRVKAEPIDLVEKPGNVVLGWRAGGDASSLVLAAWLYRLGQEPLAGRALARVSDRRKVLRQLRRHLAFSAYSALLYTYTTSKDVEALAHGERLLRLYSNEAAEWHTQGKTIVDDLKRRKRVGTFGRKPTKLPETFDRWDVKKQVIYLIDALEDVAEHWSGSGWAALQDEPRMAALIAIGEPAVHALIGVIEKDKRLTRRLRMTEGPLRPQSVLPVREAALMAIHSILRPETPFSFSDRGGLWANDEDLAREMARELRAHVRKHGRLTFDERMMKVLTDPEAKPESWREAALELAQFGKQRESMDAMTGAAKNRRATNCKRRNPAIAKYDKPTVGEAILAAMDRELKACTATRRHDRECNRIEDAYLRALHELSDTRVVADAAKRSRSARGRMRYEWAYLCHCLQEPCPLASVAKEFERGKVELPEGEEGRADLHRIVFHLVSAATRESDRALHALADRKHPAHHLAREAILVGQPLTCEAGAWFHHPFCLEVLRQALDDTTRTGVTWKVEGNVGKRGQQVEQRVCDGAATKLWEFVYGPTGSYNPLPEKRDESLREIKLFLDCFKGRLQRVNKVQEDLLNIYPAYVRYVPNIAPLTRPATAEDVKARRAIFHLAGKGKVAPQKFPASAQLDGGFVLIVQAESGPDGMVTYGVISRAGLHAVAAAKLSNIRCFSE